MYEIFYNSTRCSYQHKCVNYLFFFEKIKVLFKELIPLILAFNKGKKSLQSLISP